MYESFHIANLFYDMNETPKHSKDPVFYIISTSWFNRWKKYVNFDYYMSNTDKILSQKDPIQSPLLIITLKTWMKK